MLAWSIFSTSCTLFSPSINIWVVRFMCNGQRSRGEQIWWRQMVGQGRRRLKTHYVAVFVCWRLRLDDIGSETWKSFCVDDVRALKTAIKLKASGVAFISITTLRTWKAINILSKKDLKKNIELQKAYCKLGINLSYKKLVQKALQKLNYDWIMFL